MKNVLSTIVTIVVCCCLTAVLFAACSFGIRYGWLIADFFLGA